MGYRYSVLGSGRQGVAIAYDLAKDGEAESVRLSDVDEGLSKKSAQRINQLVGKNICEGIGCNADQPEQIRQAVRGSHATVSALPYFLNLSAAQIAIEEKTHFCDLGGNTDIVLKELELHSQAQTAGVSVLPDCGLAPGLSNLLAARAFEKLDQVETIHALCGGLPQKPRPPFQYKTVFSLHGLINEYSGEAIFLRKGKIKKIPALTELEEVKIQGVGIFEAAVTTGGTSTAPFSFKGKVKNFDYKTLRYPGHFQAFKSFSDLGLFAMDKRAHFFDLLKPLIDFPEDRDMVILQVEAQGKVKGRKKTYRALLVDKGDNKTKFSAMERTTGFPTSVIAHLQASGKIPPGAKPIEQLIPLDEFIKSLAKRGIKISETVQ